MRALLNTSTASVLVALANAQAARVFGAANIAHAIDRMRRVYRPHVSLYNPHQGKQEIERRQRQAARDDARRLSRGDGVLRLSRRGRVVEVAA